MCSTIVYKDEVAVCEVIQISVRDVMKAGVILVYKKSAV